MRVRVYRHGLGKDGRTLADRNFSFSFTERVNGSPWHSMSCRVGASVHEALSDDFLPEVSDWIALESSPGRARMLGRVDHVSVEGGVGTATANVTAVGFLDAARANDVVMVPLARQETVGTMFEFTQWFEEVINPCINTLITSGRVGPFLQKLVRALVRMKLPPTLSSLNLGDLIYVMHQHGSDFGSAEYIGSPRVMDPVRGMDIGGVRSFLKTTGKVIELLTGTFAASHSLIELFPTLEPVPESGPGSVGGYSGAFKFELDVGGNVVGEGLPDPVLGNYLGVVYRIKPWRTKPLSHAVFNNESLHDSPPGPTSQPKLPSSSVFLTPQTFPNDATFFDLVTWPDRGGRVVAPPLTFSAHRGNDSIANAATAWVPMQGGDEARFFDVMGLPIIDNPKLLERDGLRLAAATWPFLPPPGSHNGAVDDNTLFAFIQRIAAQVFQFYQPASALWTGSFAVGLDLGIRAGEVVRIPLKGELFQVYVDEVEHNVVSGGDGTVMGTTRVSFSRGAWQDSPVRDVRIKLPKITESKPSPKPTSNVRHLGIIFAGVEHKIVLDWDFVLKDVFIVPNPSPTVQQSIQKVYGTGLQWATQVGTRTHSTVIAPISSTVTGDITVPVKTEDRLFIWGDDVPKGSQIQDLRVGLNIDRDPYGVQVAAPATIMPGAFAFDPAEVAAKGGPGPGWQILAATGEKHGLSRPGVEDLAIRLDEQTPVGERFFDLRDASQIRSVVIHAPGGGLGVTAYGSVATTFRKNFEKAEVSLRSATDSETRKAALALAVSAHFVIDRKGCIWQLQDALRYAIHTASGDSDYVNKTSISIELVVPAGATTRAIANGTADKRHIFTRDSIVQRRNERYEYPDPDPTPIPAGGDVDCQRGGVFPEGGRVPLCTMLQDNQPSYVICEVQPSRAQYRALGALLTAIKAQCPNFALEFPKQEGLAEFNWKHLNRNAAGGFDAATMPAGVYIHACLSESTDPGGTHTDYLGLNRARVLKYAAKTVDQTAADRAQGDKV